MFPEAPGAGRGRGTLIGQNAPILNPGVKRGGEYALMQACLR